MATGTISYNLSITATKGNITTSITPPSISVDWNGEKYSSTQDLTVSEISLNISSDITNLGLGLFSNIGANEIYVSFDNGVSYPIVIPVDTFFQLPLNPSFVISNLKMKTLTGISRVDYTIFSADVD